MRENKLGNKSRITDHIFVILLSLHRFVHAVEPGHVRVQREVWLQTQTRVYEAARQTLRPVHWEHRGRNSGQHTVCEGVCLYCVDCTALCVVCFVFILNAFSFFLSRSFPASFCRTKKWGRMWRSTCSACRWTPRGKRSRPRRLRATPSTPSGTKRPLSSRRSHRVIAEITLSFFISHFYGKKSMDLMNVLSKTGNSCEIYTGFLKTLIKVWLDGPEMLNKFGNLAFSNNNNSKAFFAKVQRYLYPFRYNGSKFQMFFHINKLKRLC